jgi:hypothetical protein
MTTPDWDDDRLLDELRAALGGAGRPTPTMEAAGRAAFSWGSIDAELAALTFDSATEAGAEVRGSAAPPRTLVFQGEQVSVELELTDTGLTGQLIPPDHGEVALWGPDRQLASMSADELGCFTLEAPSGGPVRLRCRTSSGDLLTEWFRI